MMTESDLTKVRASGPHEQVQIIPELQADETAKKEMFAHARQNHRNQIIAVSRSCLKVY